MRMVELSFMKYYFQSEKDFYFWLLVVAVVEQNIEEKKVRNKHTDGNFE